MATVTITPDAYYLVESGVVTAINPATKEVRSENNGRINTYLHYSIPVTADWQYSVITKITYTLHGFSPHGYTSYFSPGVAYSWKGKQSLTVGESASYRNFTYLGNSSYTWAAGGDTTFSFSQESAIPTDLNDSELWICYNGGATTYTYSFTSTSITIEYVDVLTPTFSLIPIAGYLLYSRNNVFTLSNTNTQRTLNKYSAGSGTLKYKLSSATNYNSIPFTGASVTMPANTLTNGQNYNIYADFTTTNSLTGSTEVGDYTTVDTIGTTTGQTPNNSIEYGNVTFTWAYRNNTGTAQYAYDLDISDDGTTYTTVLSHVVTSATTATYNVSTAGGKYWRVRGYNQNDVAGNYSTPLYFVNNIPPSPPVITNITGAGRLTVTWAADNQSAYEVEVYNGDTRVYDSTVVYTADTTHLINEYLPNGTYTIKVKTINIYGHTSDYATTVYTVSNVGSLSVSGTYENGTATLSYPDGNYAKYYIQRDGVTIAKTTEKTYTDMYMNGTATYTVIAVNSDDSYAIGTATVSGTVPFTRFVDLDGNVYDISKRWQQRIGVQVSNEAEYDTALYLGAKRPAHTFGTGRIRRYAIAFTYEGDYTVFMGKVLRYMDIYGNADYVVVPNINEVEARYGNELTASLEVTDYNEGITYDL